MNKEYGINFNIAHVEPISHIYGPGKRYVVWFQGCSLACDGCWNKEMWSFKAKELVGRELLLQQILDAPDIQGVTFLGGEPLHQVNNFIWLLRQIRAQSELTIFLYTGYEQAELEVMSYWPELELLCDMMAIGRYQQEQRNIHRQWVGSDNQKVKFTGKSRLNKQQPDKCNEAEIFIGESGEVRILGFPDRGLIESYK